ncbi:hypothetical protein RUND412_008712 [Rhizina undulata]
MPHQVDPEKDMRVGVSNGARVECRRCMQGIGEGFLRLGVWRWGHFWWYHWDCLTDKQLLVVLDTMVNHGPGRSSIAQFHNLEGYYNLSEDFKSVIRNSTINAKVRKVHGANAAWSNGEIVFNDPPEASGTNVAAELPLPCRTGALGTDYIKQISTGGEGEKKIVRLILPTIIITSKDGKTVKKRKTSPVEESTIPNTDDPVSANYFYFADQI